MQVSTDTPHSTIPKWISGYKRSKKTKEEVVELIRLVIIEGAEIQAFNSGFTGWNTLKRPLYFFENNMRNGFLSKGAIIRVNPKCNYALRTVKKTAPLDRYLSWVDGHSEINGEYARDYLCPFSKFIDDLENGK